MPPLDRSILAAARQKVHAFFPSKYIGRFRDRAEVRERDQPVPQLDFNEEN
jgi:hypothetical protein